MATINKNQFIRELSKRTGFLQKDLLEVMDNMGELIYEHLKERDTVKPFDGVIFYDDLIENRTAYNFRTSEVTQIDQMLIPKVRFTGYAKDKIRGTESYYSRVVKNKNKDIEQKEIVVDNEN